jgi:alginate O-acetyltransferase complex protein AlgI
MSEAEKIESPDSAQSSSGVGYLPLCVLPLAAVTCRGELQPWLFMWILAFSIFVSLKWLTWWKARTRIAHPAWRSAAYLLAWPGMDAESFLDASRHVAPPPLRAWLWAMFKTALGASLFWAIARKLPPGQALLRGWIGMLGLILILHFGTFEIAALFWRSLGVDAVPIMSDPLRSRSLSEFWGKRWNLGFRQLSHDLMFQPLHRILGAGVAGFLVFISSGLIHDLVISVPARGGYGLPTIYFVIQGLGVAVERSAFRRKRGLRRNLRGWFFLAVLTVGPLFLLFHSPFVLRVIIPFMKAAHAL